MSSNLPMLLIDSRSGNVVMRLANGEVLVGKSDLSPGDYGKVTKPWLVAALAKPQSGSELLNWASSRWEEAEQRASALAELETKT